VLELTISEPLNANQVGTYYKEKFTRGYYFKGQEGDVEGQWFGRRAALLAWKTEGW